MLISELQPFPVFRYFSAIAGIPHGSGNEKRLSDYIVSVAQEKGLRTVQDDARNVVVYVSAAPGCEQAPPLILQAHIDMVCEKNADTNHDFETDPLSLYIEGDFLQARGTTLGADNGVGAAMMLALLDTDAPHPPLELLFTTDEETGMSGAIRLDASLLSARRLLNLDSDEEGIFCTSCAGGLRATVTVPIARQPAAPGAKPYALRVRGLVGGHSGIEIGKERANSNRVLARAFYGLSQELSFGLSHIQGGLKDNAIPREADATLWLNPADEEKALLCTGKLAQAFQNEYRKSDPGLNLSLTPVDSQEAAVFDEASCRNVIAALLLLPNGIQNMNLDIAGLPETSNNIGIVRTADNGVSITSALRSSVVSRKFGLADQIKVVADTLGASYESHGDYPAWEYAPESSVRDACFTVYRALYGTEPAAAAIHAGLECGLFSEKMPGIDMISFGPNIYEAHTPQEKVSLSSVERVWRYLLALLQALC